MYKMKDKESNYKTKKKSLETGSQDGEEDLYRRSTSIYGRNGVIQSDRNTYPPLEKMGKWWGEKTE
jgi:hypothetical protein